MGYAAAVMRVSGSARIAVTAGKSVVPVVAAIPSAPPARTVGYGV